MRVRWLDAVVLASLLSLATAWPAAGTTNTPAWDQFRGNAHRNPVLNLQGEILDVVGSFGLGESVSLAWPWKHPMLLAGSNLLVGLDEGGYDHGCTLLAVTGYPSNASIQDHPVDGCGAGNLIGLDQTSGLAFVCDYWADSSVPLIYAVNPLDGSIAWTLVPKMAFGGVVGPAASVHSQWSCVAGAMVDGSSAILVVVGEWAEETVRVAKIEAKTGQVIWQRIVPTAVFYNPEPRLAISVPAVPARTPLFYRPTSLVVSDSGFAIVGVVNMPCSAESQIIASGVGVISLPVSPLASKPVAIWYDLDGTYHGYASAYDWLSSCNYVYSSGLAYGNEITIRMGSEILTLYPTAAEPNRYWWTSFGAMPEPDIGQWVEGVRVGDRLVLPYGKHLVSFDFATRTSDWEIDFGDAWVIVDFRHVAWPARGRNLKDAGTL